MKQRQDKQMNTAQHRLWKKIAQSFPDAVLDKWGIDFGGHSLRFELGAPHPNGSLKRVVQSTKRATTLYHDLFSGSRPLVIVAYDWDASGKEIHSSEPPGYLFTLISGYVYSKSMSDRSVKAKTSKLSRLFIPTNSKAIDCRKLFRAIANNEQGRIPRVNQKVYCVDLEADIAFHMYDDRGCMVNIMDKERWLDLRNKRRKWLIN